MKKVILSFIFIPIIGLFAMFLFLQIGLHSSDPNTSHVNFWNHFKRIWMTSFPLYGLIITTVFYIVLLIKSPKIENS